MKTIFRNTRVYENGEFKNVGRVLKINLPAGEGALIRI